MQGVWIWEMNFIDYCVQYLINRNLSLIQMVTHVEKGKYHECKY